MESLCPMVGSVVGVLVCVSVVDDAGSPTEPAAAGCPSPLASGAADWLCGCLSVCLCGQIKMRTGEREWMNVGWLEIATIL